MPGEMNPPGTFPLRCEWPLPGEAGVKRHGDPLARDIYLSSIEARMIALRRTFDPPKNETGDQGHHAERHPDPPKGMRQEHAEEIRRSSERAKAARRAAKTAPRRLYD